jgi:hypothetical protein
MNIGTRGVVRGALFVIAAGLALPAAAQPVPAAPGAAPVARQSTGHPKRDTLVKLMRPITIEFTDQRLEDVIAFVRDFTAAEIEVMWMDDRNPEGLDPESPVTLKVENVTVLALLERVLDQVRGDFGENTWQMGDYGALEIGPKERLNKRARVEIYDINDLLLDIPDYDEVPEIDLQQALQAAGSGGGGGGGGGGQGPFEEQDEEEEDERIERQEKAQEIIDLITALVETEQWVDNGGNGATIRYYQGSVIVKAPDYIHRGLVGYTYWPSRLTRVAQASGGRRYVTLTTDQGISTIDGIRQVPASAVVGGKIIESGPPGGGG